MPITASYLRSGTNLQRQRVSKDRINLSDRFIHFKRPVRETSSQSIQLTHFPKLQRTWSLHADKKLIAKGKKYALPKTRCNKHFLNCDRQSPNIARMSRWTLLKFLRCVNILRHFQSTLLSIGFFCHLAQRIKQEDGTTNGVGKARGRSNQLFAGIAQISFVHGRTFPYRPFLGREQRRLAQGHSDFSYQPKESKAIAEKSAASRLSRDSLNRFLLSPPRSSSSLLLPSSRSLVFSLGPLILLLKNVVACKAFLSFDIAYSRRIQEEGNLMEREFVTENRMLIFRTSRTDLSLN